MCKGYNNERKTPRWHYDVIPEKLNNIDLGQYDTYGIQLTEPGRGEILHDVSISEKTVFWMTELINKYQLSPIHLRDVVEDLLP